MEQLSEKNVEAGADDFIVAMKSYMPDLKLYWSDEFLEHMDDELYGSLIRELIFQEHFTKKDFENWATRMRKIIVGQISLEEYKEAVNEMEW